MRTVDLNLFHVFDLLMKNKSVAATARQLGVTPSAISHSLMRLRKALGDELFLAGAAGMEPTPYAVNISSEIRAGLSSFAKILARPEVDPITMTRVFTVAASEYTATRIVAPLISMLCAEAPMASIRILPAGRLDVMRSLDEGRVDIVLGWFGEMAARYHRRELCTEEEALLVRAGHPLTAADLTTQDIMKFPFLVVELTGSEDRGLGGYIEERQSMRRTWVECLLVEAERQGRKPLARVAATVPYYASAIPILQNTDMVATMPLSIATEVADRANLALLTLPYDPVKVRVEAVWSHRLDNDLELQWLIDKAAAFLSNEQ